MSALPDAPAGFRRVGHKGAADLVEGNTIASFERAVEIGVDMIEFDVLRLRDGAPELPRPIARRSSSPTTGTTPPSAPRLDPRRRRSTPSPGRRSIGSRSTAT